MIPFESLKDEEKDGEIRFSIWACLHSMLKERRCEEERKLLWSSLELKQEDEEEGLNVGLLNEFKWVVGPSCPKTLRA